MSTKTETIEIDLDSYDKDLLIKLISFAHKNNYTFNEAIVSIIKKYLENADI
jgi:hypothetical protein